MWAHAERLHVVLCQLFLECFPLECCALTMFHFGDSNKTAKGPLRRPICNLHGHTSWWTLKMFRLWNQNHALDGLRCLLKLKVSMSLSPTIQSEGAGEVPSDVFWSSALGRKLRSSKIRWVWIVLLRLG